MRTDRESGGGDFFEDVERVGNRAQVDMQQTLFFDCDGSLTNLREHSQNGLRRRKRSVDVAHGKFDAKDFGNQRHIVGNALSKRDWRIAEA